MSFYNNAALIGGFDLGDTLSFSDASQLQQMGSTLYNLDWMSKPQKLSLQYFLQKHNLDATQGHYMLGLAQYLYTLLDVVFKYGKKSPAGQKAMDTARGLLIKIKQDNGEDFYKMFRKIVKWMKMPATVPKASFDYLMSDQEGFYPTNMLSVLKIPQARAKRSMPVELRTHLADWRKFRGVNKNNGMNPRIPQFQVPRGGKRTKRTVDPTWGPLASLYYGAMNPVTGLIRGRPTEASPLPPSPETEGE